MQTIVKTVGSSAGISLLLILPFMIMEIVNRRQFNEEFPFVLFFALWLNLFAITLILFPIVRAMQKGKADSANPVPAPGNALLANPKPALAISVVLILSVVLVGLLESLGGGLTESISNGSNSEQLYVWGIRIPSQFIALMVISMPIAAGIIAGVPIVSALRAGGSLFAHPIHLMIVVFIASILVIGFANLIIDQWPCFIGVPNCD